MQRNIRIRTRVKAAVRWYGYRYFEKRNRLRAATIDTRPDAVFIWIPKTAGTSLHSCLSAPKLKSIKLLREEFTGKGVVTFGHMNFAELVQLGYVSRGYQESAFKFAVVRDPYARAVSLFRYLRKIESLPPHLDTFLSFCRELNDKGCDPVGIYNECGLSQCRPQVEWLDGVEMDLLGRAESIGDFFSELKCRLSLGEVELPHLNSTGGACDHESYFCVESKQIVEEYYHRDFELLGYPKRMIETVR